MFVVSVLGRGSRRPVAVSVNLCGILARGGLHVWLPVPALSVSKLQFTALVVAFFMAN